jgi:prepilin-type N-terminal cleavage/methylation domain-containing protein/prepilin-type processing-associated H-X9-DG protein
MVPISMRLTIRQPSARTKAFTLIELLVVITIIAILAGISLAVNSSVRKSADRTKCLSNLRNIGRAISTFLGDHEGHLPGPLWESQSCWYNERDIGTLGNQLAGYMGLPLDYEKRRMDAFVCPAWQKGAPYQDDESFLLNTAVVVNGDTIHPWGDADLPEEEAGSDPNSPAVPKLLASLSDASLSRTWAVQDLDKQSVVKKKIPGIAPKPVHGDKRNALFFDFHVESIPLNYKP